MKQLIEQNQGNIMSGMMMRGNRIHGDWYIISISSAGIASVCEFSTSDRTWFHDVIRNAGAVPFQVTIAQNIFAIVTKHRTLKCNIIYININTIDLVQFFEV